MKNLKDLGDGNFVIKNVRLSYLFCFEPQTNVDAKTGKVTKKYKVTGIMPNDTHAEEIKYLRDYMTKVQKDVFKARLPADKLCLRDGDQSGKDEYENAWIFVASEREDNPPACLDIDGKRQVKKSDDKLYSGAWGNIRVRLWTQNNDFGKRINANFLGVQWVREDDKFSAVERPKADEMFDSEGEIEEGDAWDDDGV